MKNVIEIKDLSFSYEKNKNVLREVNLSIEEGAIVAILGKTVVENLRCLIALSVITIISRGK